MNMLLQLLRLRQACNHPWLVKGAPGVPDAFASSIGGSSGTSGTAGQAGGARAATAAEVAAVRRLAPDSKAALLQVSSGRPLRQHNHHKPYLSPHLLLHSLNCANRLILQGVAYILPQLTHGCCCVGSLQALQGCSSMCGSCGDVPEDPSITRCCHIYCRTCLVSCLEAPGGAPPAAAAAGGAEGLGSDGLGFNCLVCGSLVRPGDTFRGAAVEAAATAAAAGAAAGGKGGGKGSRGKSPAAALEKSWRSSSKVDKVVELLSDIRRRNEAEASTAAGSAAAAAAAAALRAAPLAARSKTDSRLLQQMRRGTSPGAAGGSSAAAAAGSSGSNAAAPAAAGVAAVRPEKAIVFSQWTSMLDLLEVPLKKAGFVFRRLDGTMTVAARERAIADFESSPEVRHKHVDCIGNWVWA